MTKISLFRQFFLLILVWAILRFPHGNAGQLWCWLCWHFAPQAHCCGSMTLEAVLLKYKILINFMKTHTLRVESIWILYISQKDISKKQGTKNKYLTTYRQECSLRNWCLRSLEAGKKKKYKFFNQKTITDYVIFKFYNWW